MGYVKVKRRDMTFTERTYLLPIAKGMVNTITHLGKSLFSDGQVTMQYPEQKWELPDRYRGVPVLVKDADNREKCVSCSMCEYVCPPRAISILPGQIEGPVEKAPKEFDIDMLRCIFCGLCEEVCPEEAIFMSEEYEVCGETRDSLIFRKDKLYELGEKFGRDGRVKAPVKKYEKLVNEAAEQGLDLSQ